MTVAELLDEIRGLSPATQIFLFYAVFLFFTGFVVFFRPNSVLGITGFDYAGLDDTPRWIGFFLMLASPLLVFVPSSIRYAYSRLDRRSVPESGDVALVAVEDECGQYERAADGSSHCRDQ